MNRFQEHKERLERFAEPGGPLARGSRHATVNNPRLFHQGEHAPEPTRERRELHQRLLREWEEASPGAAGRQAIVLAGPPGAGKSSSQKALIEATGIPEEDWRIVNNDDFKDRLLLASLDDGSYERDILPREVAESGERVWPRELAPLVHEEAGMLADEARKRAIREGSNVVIDGTLSWEPGADELMQELERNGYSVRVAVVDAPQDVVEARVEHRWRSDYLAAENGEAADPLTARLGGRSVPPGVVAGMYDDRDQSVCVDVARSVAERHGSVAEYRHARVTEPAGSPKPVERRGRLQPGGPLLDAETYKAATNAQASAPHAARPHATAQGPRPGRARPPARRPDRGAER